MGFGGKIWLIFFFRSGVFFSSIFFHSDSSFVFLFSLAPLHWKLMILLLFSGPVEVSRKSIFFLHVSERFFMTFKIIKLLTVTGNYFLFPKFCLYPNFAKGGEQRLHVFHLKILIVVFCARKLLIFLLQNLDKIWREALSTIFLQCLSQSWKLFLSFFPVIMLVCVFKCLYFKRLWWCDCAIWVVCEFFIFLNISFITFFCLWAAKSIFSWMKRKYRTEEKNCLFLTNTFNIDWNGNLRWSILAYCF